MAPRRKSGAAAATTAASVASDDVVDGPGIEELYLPKSLLTRIAKGALPEGTSLAKEIPTALQNGSTVFISYVTMLAHDIATERKQKTITASHVLDAVKQLGWDDQPEISRRLKKELSAFRKLAEAKKNATAGPTPKGAFGRKPAAAGGNDQVSGSVPSAARSTSATVPTATSAAVGVTVDGNSTREDEDAEMTVLVDGRPNPDEEELLGEDDEEVYEGGEDEEEEQEEEGEEEEQADEDEEAGLEEEEDQTTADNGPEDDERSPNDDTRIAG